MGKFKLNGIDVPSPKVLSPALMDLDSENSYRTADGNMQRDRITQKRKLHLEWGPLKLNEVSIVLKAINDLYCSATYPDILSGTWETRTFYAGDRDVQPLYDEATDMFTGLSFDLIEK